MLGKFRCIQCRRKNKILLYQEITCSVVITGSVVVLNLHHFGLVIVLGGLVIFLKFLPAAIMEVESKYNKLSIQEGALALSLF